MQNMWHIWLAKIKIALKHANISVSTNTLQLLLCNNSNVFAKNSLYSENESILISWPKMSHNAWAIAHAKYVTLGQKIKIALQHANKLFLQTH